MATCWIAARANVAFLGPAVASLWAEAPIFFFRRETPLGPRAGELAGTGLAWALVLLVVVLPTLRVSVCVIVFAVVA